MSVFWNFIQSLTPGTLAKAEDMNTNFSGIDNGLDLVEAEIVQCMQITNSPGVTDIVLSPSVRANKLVEFDVNGDIAATTIMGDWKGDHADAAGTDYQIRDVVKDAADSLGLNNLYICIETHTSTGSLSTDTAKWDLLIDAAVVAAVQVTITDAGSIYTATDTEGALQEVKLLADASTTKLAGIESGATADQSAAEVVNTPAGNIAATDVQAAINELDTEKVGLAGDESIAGKKTLTDLLSLSAGANIASAATIDLTAATGNSPRITGTTATSAVTMNSGLWVLVVADGAWPLTYHATNNKLNGGVDYTCAAGDRVLYQKDLSGIVHGFIIPSSSLGIKSVSASVAASALTVGAAADSLDFRSATLTDGVPASLSFGNLSLVVPSTATLGTVSGIQSEIYLLVINNDGVPKIAVVNSSGGVDLSERGVITTVAIDATADSANVIYSDAVYTNVAYRVYGSITSTQAVAGTWATAPSLIQGMGGNALTTMSSLGYGQTRIEQKASRTSGVTYYNTGSKPKHLNISLFQALSANLSVTIGGVVECALVNGSATVTSLNYSGVVQPGESYIPTWAGTLDKFVELG